MIVGYQYMLFGANNGEIVVEVQITNDLEKLEGQVSSDYAARVLAAANWTTDVLPDEWWVEKQALHRR